MADTTDKMPLSDVDLAAEINARQESREKWEAAMLAFEELYRRHADRLLLFLSSRVVDDDVEEVHRQVWETVWQHGMLPTDPGNFAGWLYVIAHGEIAAYRHKLHGSQLETPSNETIIDVTMIDETIIDRERVAMMTECMHDLDDDVAAVVRRRFAGESFEVISFDLDVDVAQAEEMFGRGKALISVYFNRASTRK
jgi:DNA-directed RNA polymerase specialized sigma24 family protein